MRILLAEDDEMLLSLLEFRLKKEGYEVLKASDGKKAVEMIKEEKPDLIITDIMMPFLSGLELVNEIKSNLGIETPIIILSSSGQEKTVMEAFKLGVSDFISKPFSPNELIIRIQRVMK